MEDDIRIFPVDRSDSLYAALLQCCMQRGIAGGYQSQIGTHASPAGFLLGGIAELDRSDVFAIDHSDTGGRHERDRREQDYAAY